mgnify:CR=1 FL=1
MLNLFGKSLNDTSGNTTQPIKVSAASTKQAGETGQAMQHSESNYINQMSKFCSFVSIAMTLFDGNYHVLLVKNEMKKP